MIVKKSEVIREKMDEAGATMPKVSIDDINDLDIELNELLNIIKNVNHFSEAEKYLADLGNLQFVFAKLYFKYHISISNKQRSLVRLFDRCEDLEVQQKVFYLIKSGRLCN